jgi:hypothetical protein
MQVVVVFETRGSGRELATTNCCRLVHYDPAFVFLTGRLAKYEQY